MCTAQAPIMAQPVPTALDGQAAAAELGGKRRACGEHRH